MKLFAMFVGSIIAGVATTAVGMPPSPEKGFILSLSVSALWCILIETITDRK